MLTDLRARTTNLGRFVLGVFVVGWFGAAAESCMLVDESGQSAAMDGVHSAHAMHGMPADLPDEPAGSAPCGHCPDGIGSGCHDGVDSVVEDCRQGVGTWHDVRHGDAKTKDKSLDKAGAKAPQFPRLAARSEGLNTAPRGAAYRATGPSLNIRFCVYLK